jgi:DNA-directed RNA polymerase I, II, and III subunit RPABC2
MNEQTVEIPRINKYEKARVIGIRALQLSKGAPPMVSTTGLTSVIEIAKKELISGKMPIILSRRYPDGSTIDIKVSDMIID